MDPGLGGMAQRRTLGQTLGTGLLAGSERAALLRWLAEDVDQRYLSRWRDALNVQQHGHQAERVARLIAAHLLDRGYSQDFLHRWLSYLCHHDPVEHDLVSIVAAADALTRKRLNRYRVLVLFETPYPSGVSLPTAWLDLARTDAWLDAKGVRPLVSDVRYNGALLLRLKGTDPEAAVAQAGDIVDALIARTAVGTRSTLVAHRDAFVAGIDDRRLQLRRPRRVEVRALERQDRLADDLYSMVQSPVDAALQLLSHLDTSPDESAVGGAWSAIESLLTAPGDEANVVAADRLASLVACAWPRAELTTLAARRMSAFDDSLSRRLRAEPTNRRRAEVIAAEIRAARWLRLEAADSAAVRRVERLFKAPRSTLQDVEQYATEAVRRLYRQRNLVLHGGRTDAVALRASLRTVAPLVGAGMDRIVHAHLQGSADPLALAARARLELQRVGDIDAPPLTALLEP